MDWLYTKHLVDYSDAIEFMDKKIQDILLYPSICRELIWFLEHPSVYTYGSMSHPSEMVTSPLIPTYYTSRGGKYTYHGPGQRIVYLLINLKARNLYVREYVHTLETWCISALRDVGIKSFTLSGKIGVWTNYQGIKKIAAIGVRVKKGITMHGIAINIKPNLSYFDNIIPCGIKEYGVTSLENLGVDITLQNFDRLLTKNLPQVFL